MLWRWGYFTFLAQYHSSWKILQPYTIILKPKLALNRIQFLIMFLEKYQRTCDLKLIFLRNHWWCMILTSFSISHKLETFYKVPLTKLLFNSERTLRTDVSNNPRPPSVPLATILEVETVERGRGLSSDHKHLVSSCFHNIFYPFQWKRSSGIQRKVYKIEEFLKLIF